MALASLTVARLAVVGAVATFTAVVVGREVVGKRKGREERAAAAVVLAPKTACRCLA